MKKRAIIALVCVMLVILIGVGTTYALLMSKSRPIVNTFVSGDIVMTLTESTGSNYKLVPGNTIKKDPRIMVGGGSEECWVFFKLDCDDALSELISYSISDGWTALEGVENVYYRHLEKSNLDREYYLLKDNAVIVSSSATEERLAALGSNTKITVFAYAVQYQTISTPQKAGEIIGREGE